VPESDGAQRVAEHFWEDLNDLMSTLNSENAVRACAIVTGRNPIIQAALQSRRARNFNREDALSVVGFHELDNKYFNNLHSINLGDLRGIWWKKFAAVKGLSATPPPVFESHVLKSLTDEPLLCYLLALSGKAEESRKTSIANSNQVYEKIIDDVWNRVWGDEINEVSQLSEETRQQIRRTGPIAFFRSKKDFELLLEYIAIAAWRSGESRIANVEQFEDCIRNTEAELIWQQFRESFNSQNRDETFSTLALTFFFKGEESNSRGFEFTHKTFGEYLVARRLIKTAISMLGRFEAVRVIEELDPWKSLTSQGVMSDSILEFLQNEVQLLETFSLHRLRSSLQRPMQLLIKNGWKLPLGEKDTWRIGELRQRNIEASLLSVLSATTIALFERREIDTPSKIFNETSKTTELKGLIARLRMNFEEFGPSVIPLGGFDLSNPKTDSMYLFVLMYDFDIHFSKIDFSYSSIDQVFFQNSIVKNSEFRNASLKRSMFYKSYFSWCSFNQGNLQRLLLKNCEVVNCSFINAKLNGADLGESIFLGCDFSEADFSDCSLRRVKIKNSTMTNARFSNTDVVGVNLSSCKGLTQKQVIRMTGSKGTRLPPGLKKPKRWG
jgi:uncharacterized protein YjbI with pentapeptide repeats